MLAVLMVLSVLPRSRAVPKPDADGYLIRMAPEAPVLLSEDSPLEPVVPGLYRTDDEALARELMREGLAEYVEPNYRVELLDADEPDPEPALPWSWQILGGPEAEAQGLTGSGVRIAVIDSGIDPGVENLAGRAITAGRSYLEPEASPLGDGIGHGTAVAQMIVGRGVNSLERGLAPEAELISMRCFFPYLSTYTDTLVEVLYDVINEFDCNVINMSWGVAAPAESSSALSRKNFRALEEVLETAQEQGIVLVAAAGNKGEWSSGSTPMYPAAFPGVISVAALTPELKRAPFSQRVDSIHVAAPGDSLRLEAPEGLPAQTKGTSFAAPAVAATVALALQLSPGLNGSDLSRALSQRAMKLEGQLCTGYGLVTVEALFGATWLSCPEENGERRLSGWRRDPEDIAVLGGYSAGGQLVSLSVLPAVYGMQGVDIPLPDPTASARLFNVSPAWIPLGTPCQLLPEPAVPDI